MDSVYSIPDPGTDYPESRHTYSPSPSMSISFSIIKSVLISLDTGDRFSRLCCYSDLMEGKEREESENDSWFSKEAGIILTKGRRNSRKRI